MAFVQRYGNWVSELLATAGGNVAGIAPPPIRLPFKDARPALPVLAATAVVGVLVGVWMSLRAFGFRDIAVRAGRILQWRNGFQVGRVGATGNAAQVVDLHAVRDRAMLQRVDETMDEPTLFADLDLGVGMLAVDGNDPASVVGYSDSSLQSGRKIIEGNHILHTTFRAGASWPL